MNKRDFYTGLVFLVFSGAVAILIVDSPSHKDPSGPGPFLFPTIATALMAILALALLIQGAREKAGAQAGSGGPSMRGRILWIVVWCAIYASTIERLGYLLSTGIVTFALLAYFTWRTWIFNVSLSVITPMLIYLLFAVALKIPMPKGYFGF